MPDSFPELNLGVVLYNKSPSIRTLFDRWLSIMNFHECTWVQPFHDQPAFRLALYETPVNWTVLTPEYNCRFIRPGFLHGEAKILHGRDINIEAVAGFLNKTKRQRIHVPGVDRMEVYLQEQVISSNSRANLIK